MKGGLSGRLTK